MCPRARTLQLHRKHPMTHETNEDGLAVLKNKSGPQSKHVKKIIQKIFKEHGLDIIIQCNMKIVNYLDVTFNLNDGTYKPFTKPNNEIKYIHKN